MNKPTATIVTDRFQVLAETVRKNLGMPALPFAITAHPIGGLKEDEVLAKANAIFEQMVKALTTK